MSNTLAPRLAAILSVTLISVPQLGAQMIVKLKPETLTEFEQYAKSVESEIGKRWQGTGNFISAEDSPSDKEKVFEGQFFVRPLQPDGKPTNITDGLIHDWVGTVFIPDTDPERVIAILRNFDAHKKIYPEIADSKTISQTGGETVGYWKVQQRKGLVPVVLEVNQNAYYTKIAPGKWNCRAYARKITEIDSGPFSSGRRYPEGEGHGYMWRMYAYWSIEQVNEGVLAECRMLSLSRSIPQAIAWAVGPYVQKAPQESLSSTLKQTKEAASNSGHRTRRSETSSTLDRIQR